MDIYQYIENYFKKTTFNLSKNKGVNIALPNKFVSPALGIFKYDQFYWDTYFTILGLLALKRVKLAQGMVDNLAYLFKKFHIIPMRNRWANLGISQEPFLTSMMWEVFEHTQDRKWLKKITLIAEEEMKSYWLDTKRAEKHLVYRGLSRFSDHYVLHVTAEQESGWDTTSRFSDKCLHFLPIDLNSCLYKYEVDLAAAYKVLGNKTKAVHYKKRAQQRRETVTQLMWNEKRGFFFDYDYVSRKQSSFYSLAAFFPLWAGLATRKQAEKVKNNLSVFEHAGGFATSQSWGLSKTFKQWDYPNGWPNLQWIAISGLIKYGFYADAKRLADKWLKLNIDIFVKTGAFWEKYNVVTRDIGKSERYDTLPGFAWTSAIFLKLLETFYKKEFQKKQLPKFEVRKQTRRRVIFSRNFIVPQITSALSRANGMSLMRLKNQLSIRSRVLFKKSSF